MKLASGHEIRRGHHGRKFGSALAAYLYDAMLNGATADADAYDGSGGSVAAYGRHLLWEDDLGNVDVDREATAADAVAVVAACDAAWNYDDDDASEA